MPVIYLNLRDYSFNTVDSLVSALDKETDTWMDKFKRISREFNLNMAGFGLTFNVGFKSNENLPAITNLNDLLLKLSAQMPPRTFWRENRTPVFVIDEANELHSLTKAKDGHSALVNLFKWLTINTKELHKFYALLISSNSFFHLWVENFIGTSRYTNYVVGHLHKSDARKFGKSSLFLIIMLFHFHSKMCIKCAVEA